MSSRHEAKVAKLQHQIAKFYKTKTPFKIYHGSTNSTRIQEFRRDQTVDASNLTGILEVTPPQRFVRVEPNVPMDKLVRETLRFNLIPEVVMEFPGITVGGGVAGVGGESSSFRYGVFSETCESLEVITPDGQLHEVSQNREAELYHGLGGSFGTLGVLTAVQVRLIPAKKFVNLTYFPIKDFRESVEKLKNLAKENYDYLDGIMFADRRGVIMAGRLSDEKIGKIQHFSRSRDDWFYLHADKISRKLTSENFIETVPIRDYLFRYDRGAFWVGKYAFEVFGVPFNRFSRMILNPILHTRKLYEALQESGASQQFLTQDLGLPFVKAVEFMEFIDRKFVTYPLWLCPLKPNDHSPFQLNNMKTPLAINVGVWGNRIENYDEFVRQNRELEAELLRLGGKKWLYAQSFYPEKDFVKMFDTKNYKKLREKYHAEYLPSVYDKVSVTKYWPVEIKRGLWRTIFRQAKLRVQ